MFGPPDSIETRPSVGSSGEDGQTSSFKNGIVADSTHPYQVWHYNHLKGIGDDQNFKFLDVCSCGNYKLVD